MMGIYWSIITSKLNKTHIIMYFCDWRFWVSIFPVVFTSFIDHSSLMTCYWVEFSHKIHRSSFICGNSEDFSHVSLWARWDYVGHSTVLIKLPLLVMIRFIKAVKYTIYPTGGGWKLCVFSFSFFFCLLFVGSDVWGRIMVSSLPYLQVRIWDVICRIKQVNFLKCQVTTVYNTKLLDVSFCTLWTPKSWKYVCMKWRLIFYKYFRIFSCFSVYNVFSNTLSIVCLLK